mgnify:CR=1 FL=1
MQVEEFLERSFRATPEKTALVCGNARYTYTDIEKMANRLAHSLLANGFARGDRAAVYLENSVEAVVAIFAILKTGGVFLPVNPTTKPDKLAYILNNCRAKALFTNAKLLAAAAKSLGSTSLEGVWVADGDARVANIPVFPLSGVLEDASLPETPPAKRAIDIDLAALIYTSGSTGRPKGVMLTHLNMVSAATSITTYLENTPDDVILSVLPMSFDYGLYQVLMAFKVGCTVVLEKSFTYPYAVIDLLIRERVTGFPIVPTICAILLQMDLSKFSFPALRYITNTAAARRTP